MKFMNLGNYHLPSLPLPLTLPLTLPLPLTVPPASVSVEAQSLQSLLYEEQWDIWEKMHNVSRYHAFFMIPHDDNTPCYNIITSDCDVAAAALTSIAQSSCFESAIVYIVHAVNNVCKKGIVTIPKSGCGQSSINFYEYY
jgi:hypothetical protein